MKAETEARIYIHSLTGEEDGAGGASTTHGKNFSGHSGGGNISFQKGGEKGMFHMAVVPRTRGPLLLFRGERGGPAPPPISLFCALSFLLALPFPFPPSPGAIHIQIYSSLFSITPKGGNQGGDLPLLYLSLALGEAEKETKMEAQEGGGNKGGNPPSSFFAA